MLSIKANIPLGKKIAVLRAGSYCGILFCRHIGGWLLVAGIATRPVAWERCLRADCKQARRNLPCLRTAPHVALLCFDRYNTTLQEIFPPRKQIIWNFAWLCFGCGHVSFHIRNNVTGGVYCLHALNRAHLPRAGVLSCFPIWARRSSLS